MAITPMNQEATLTSSKPGVYLYYRPPHLI